MLPETTQPTTPLSASVLSRFKSASTDTIKSMFKGNPSIRLWLSGKPVLFENDEGKSELRTISATELGRSFQIALSSHCPEIMKFMWDANPSIREYYNVQPTPVVDVIQLNNAMVKFRSILPSKCPHIIMSIWKENPSLRSWFSGISVSIHGNPVMRVIPLSDLVSNFQMALLSQCKELIKSIWLSDSPVLRELYSGKPVHLSDNESQTVGMCTLLLADLATSFRTALCARFDLVIDAMWEGNPSLQEYFIGQHVRTANNESVGLDSRTNALTELNRNFKSALASNSKKLIKSLWDKNPLLRDWYTGKNVCLSGHDFQVRLDVLVKNFESALTSRTPYLIMAMWNENELLRNWFSGKDISASNKSSDLKIIPSKVLIGHMRSILSTQTPIIIEEMWRNNERLHKEIKDLKEDQSISLLKAVMSSNKGGKSTFIVQYLNCLENTNIVRAVLKEIQKSCKNKKTSIYRNNQITLLESRLNGLLEAEHYSVPRKMKAPPATKASSSKRQKIEPPIAELSIPQDPAEEQPPLWDYDLLNPLNHQNPSANAIPQEHIQGNSKFTFFDQSTPVAITDHAPTGQEDESDFNPELDFETWLNLC